MRKLLYLPSGEYVSYSHSRGSLLFDYDLINDFRMNSSSIGDKRDFILVITSWHLSGEFYKRNKIIRPCYENEFQIIEYEEEEA